MLFVSLSRSLALALALRRSIRQAFHSQATVLRRAERAQDAQHVLVLGERLVQLGAHERVDGRDVLVDEGVQASDGVDEPLAVVEGRVRDARLLELALEKEHEVAVPGTPRLGAVLRTERPLARRVEVPVGQGHERVGQRGVPPDVRRLGASPLVGADDEVDLLQLVASLEVVRRVRSTFRDALDGGL